MERKREQGEKEGRAGWTRRMEKSSLEGKGRKQGGKEGWRRVVRREKQGGKEGWRTGWKGRMKSRLERKDG